jgi:maltose alpha-D-glucosyltransferase/alpha-amylase
VDLGVDGFRIDAAPHLIKREGTNCRSLPETHAAIKKIRAALEQKYPEVILLAEAHESVEDTKKFFGDGDECHMAYHFNLMEQMWVALQQGDHLAVQKTIDESSDIPENCQWAIFLRNHDEISLATLEPGIRSALVAFLDPDGLFHFKKGEATSVRISNVYRGDREGMRKAFKLLYSLPGSPIMYYGDELGMSNLPREESIIDSRKYVRGTFDWSEAERQRKDPTSLFREVALLIRGELAASSEPPAN